MCLSYLQLRSFYLRFVFFTYGGGTVSKEVTKPNFRTGGTISREDQTEFPDWGGTVSKKDQTNFPA